MSRVDIVVIGNIIKETIQFQNRTIGPVLGSPAAYSSLVMAKIGKKIGLVSYYGDDMPEAVSELSIVDRSGFIKHPFTTRNLLVYEEDGSKYVEYQAKAPVIHFNDIPKDYLDCRFFYVCPMDYEIDLDLVEKLHAMGKVVVVDLGGFGGATSDIRYSINDATGKEVISRLCKNCTIIKASAEDLQSIIPGKTAEEAADYLSSQGATQIVITLGSKGALYQIGTAAPVYTPVFPAVSTLPDGTFDFTGAGDSFGAGFMAYYQEKQDIDAAVHFGSSTASLVIEKTGGCVAKRMPTKKQVFDRFLGAKV